MAGGVQEENAAEWQAVAGAGGRLCGRSGGISGGVFPRLGKVKAGMWDSKALLYD